MRVLFWGTPEFAAPPLRALIGEGFDVTGVVTQPDKPVGRSRSKLEPPPIKPIALAESLPVLHPSGRRPGLSRSSSARARISVVVAYGHILPTAVIDSRGSERSSPRVAAPELRGAAVQAAIREGHDETGITIMRMVKALDAGPSIIQARTLIPDDETYGELRLRLAEMGALALIEALALMDLGRSVETPQNDAEATYAPKVDRTMTRVDWTADAKTVSRIIRAYDPRPGAVSAAPSGEVKLFGARVPVVEREAEPGSVLAIDSDGMTVACARGVVQISTVHPAGKRRITPEQWARGRGIGVGERLF